MFELSNTDVEARIAPLRGIFLESGTIRQFTQSFTELLERRRSEIGAGNMREARGLAVIGGSGSGKTSLVRHVLNHHPDLVLGGPETDRMDVISLPVPTPATLKFVGQTTLGASGLQLTRERTAQTIWEMVKARLKVRQTLFLHYDEAQDLSLHQSPRELRSVVNTLKSLLQHEAWPVGLILTGTRELKTILNHDVQLARRVIPIEIPRLSAALDAGRVLDLLSRFSAAAELEIAPEVQERELAARLIHAADREFGLVIELTIATMEGAVRAKRKTVEISDFTAMFRKRSGCIDGLNPFVVEDFERIDPRHLFDTDEDAP